MLVLSRRNQESVVVGGGGGFQGLLKVTVLEATGGKVKLGFEAANDIPVHRFEVWERICAGVELESRGAAPQVTHAGSTSKTITRRKV